jgi:PAS domain-containing protein
VQRAVEEAKERGARQGAEEALLVSDDRYRRLHGSMRDAFALVDMSGRILETNRAYQEMLGYDAEELPRLNCVDLTGGPLKVVAYITDSLAIRQILDHRDMSPPEKPPPPDLRELVRVPVDEEGREIEVQPAWAACRSRPSARARGSS